MRSGVLIFVLILMTAGYNFIGSAPAAEYVTITAELEQMGTGELTELVLVDSNDNRYLVEPPHSKKLRKLTGVNLLVTGKLERIEGTQFQGKFEVDEFNTVPLKEQNLDEKVEVMGILRTVENNYFLVTPSQIILALEFSPESLLTEHSDEEVLIKGYVSLEENYKGSMEGVSYRLLQEDN